MARPDDILRLLREHTTASITSLAGRFAVSEMTVRRDLDKLVERGEVIRIPGGARLARSISFEKSFEERLRNRSDAKDRIGRAASALVEPGDAVVLDSGTTTLCIARYLRDHKNVAVFTFSLAVLEELRGCDSVRVELTGGTYRRASHDLIGPAVQETLASLHAHKVFFGAAALSFQKGVMVYDPDAPRALVRSATERILVLDSNKIGKQALYGFCPLDACDLVITDSGARPEDLARLRKVTRVVVAG